MWKALSTACGMDYPQGVDGAMVKNKLFPQQKREFVVQKAAHSRWKKLPNGFDFANAKSGDEK